ncbi:MAG TPA: hypothetical protein PK653_00055 [Syntrophales bacterium]|nr:hypothetical protein [Syntrophales bacterium]
MKFDRSRESSDWGFILPEPGENICVIGEGIEVRKNEETGKVTLMVPTKVVQGPNDSEGANINIFCPLDGSKFGKRKIADLITFSGMADAFEKKFPDPNIEPDDPRVIDAVKAALPGKMIKLKIELRKGEKGEFPDVKTISYATKKAADKPAAAPAAGSSPGAAQPNIGDW